MQRAFDSEDIIYSVLKYLERKDLKNAAMTCSWLACHALNILWSKRSSLVSLIMCLPQDTLEIEGDTIRADSQAPKLSISGLVLQRLFEQFLPTTLFPNLYAFGSHALRESSSDLSLVRMFMSPGLEELFLDVSAHFPTYEVEQFLGTLPIEAHGLRQFSISIDRGTTAFLPSLGKLPKLIALTVDVCLVRQAITNIQQARCLNILNLSLRGSSYDGGVMALELSSLEHISLSYLLLVTADNNVFTHGGRPCFMHAYIRWRGLLW
ncbi:hypothetical protein CY34DRAFT_19062 [Suillus luteus UH-Slu-Lm8-n1]|uniref:F-box domain-containing protein n=1 Tax=Suillus luteus UH-Slu-Lm8-n1 TaxID=930992 RepID=A0A0D0AKJ3_9AGAM|nr:hypothetical protein CY34DRAFT_19062 [Suillus luteus UH-Slu-Lm8-n1]